MAGERDDREAAEAIQLQKARDLFARNMA